MKFILVDFFTKEKIEETTLDKVQKDAAERNLTIKEYANKDGVIVGSLVSYSDLLKQQKEERLKAKKSIVVKKILKFKSFIQDKDVLIKLNNIGKYFQDKFILTIIFDRRTDSKRMEEIVVVVQTILDPKSHVYIQTKNTVTVRPK